MRTLSVLGFWLLLAAASACSDEENGGAPADAGDGGWDGGAAWCPDPSEVCVHYISQDPNDCIGITLPCTTEQNGFQTPCGCGCIDKGVASCPACPAPTDPEIRWYSHDPADCPDAALDCELNETPFSNSCGCGCIGH